MLTQTYRPDGKPFLAYCPRCKDRIRFECGNPNEVVCTCTVARHGFATNAVRVECIRAKLTDHRCDARCLYAKGCNCECSCGGKNHGSGHSAVAA